MSIARLLEQYALEEAAICEGGGEAAIARHHKKGRLTARERIAKLVDGKTQFFELGIFAAHEMYEEWGGVPAAGVVCGVGTVEGKTIHDHCQRRYGEGGSVLSDDGEEGHSLSEDRS